MYLKVLAFDLGQHSSGIVDAISRTIASVQRTVDWYHSIHAVSTQHAAALPVSRLRWYLFQALMYYLVGVSLTDCRH